MHIFLSNQWRVGPHKNDGLQRRSTVKYISAVPVRLRPKWPTTMRSRSGVWHLRVTARRRRWQRCFGWECAKRCGGRDGTATPAVYALGVRTQSASARGARRHSTPALDRCTSDRLQQNNIVFILRSRRRFL